METIESKQRTAAVQAAAVEFISPGGIRKIVRSPKTDVKAEQTSIPFKGGSLAIRSWGTGKTVLLVHGWAANQTDMYTFVPFLIEHGFKPVVMDLPAHGESVGETAGLDQLSEGVLAVGAHLEHLDGLIAHSIGCAASQLAIAKGLSVRKAAMLASPNNYEIGLRSFAKQRGFDALQTEDLIKALADLGVRVAIRSADFVQSLTIPCLIVHSDDDPLIPMSTAEELSLCWPNSKLLKVTGLKHRGVLKDSSVIAHVLDFLSEQ